jgi:hypothetical protein
LQSRCLNHTSSPFFSSYFADGVRELCVWAGLEPWSFRFWHHNLCEFNRQIFWGVMARKDPMQFWFVEYPTGGQKFGISLSLNNFFFFLVLGFELRAYTLSHSTSPFFLWWVFSR